MTTKPKVKTFARMSRKDRAVAVAKDVIEQLDKRGRASYALNGGYIAQRNRSVKFSGEEDLQDCADKVQKSCSVCALGAFLISKARLFNHAPMSTILEASFSGDTKFVNADRDGIVGMLRGVITDTQADAIETAYERYVHWSATNLLEKALAFGKAHRDRKPRLRAIMQNIVDNDGTFKP